MHRHDLDLIAAFADGDLTNEAQARELISKCEECSAEYQLQQSMAADLQGLSAAVMTESEKAALHRDLWTELSSPARDPAPSRVPPLMRWSFGVAAVIALFVGTFSVLSNVETDDSTGESFTEIGSSLGSAGEEPLVRQDAPQEGADGGASGANTTAAAAAESPAELDDADGTAEAEPSYFAAIDSWRKSRATTPYANFSPASVEDTVRSCLIEAGLEGYEPVGEFDLQSEFLLAVPGEAVATPDAPVTVVDPDTCEVIHTDG